MLTPRGLRKLLEYLIAGTRGGLTRAKIIHTLMENPQNAHQLSKLLSLDYTTVRHHLDVLLENSLLVVQGEHYGQLFQVSPELKADYSIFTEIWNRVQTSGPGQARSRRNLGKDRDRPTRSTSEMIMTWPRSEHSG